MPNQHDLKMFAVSAPGIEGLTLDELRGLGVKGSRVEQGGVAFTGNREALYAANLRLRTASRILVRVARFHADSFSELERRARKIPWTDFIAPTGTSEAIFRVTCHKSRLYHSDAVAERLTAAANRAGVRAKLGGSGAENETDEESGPTGLQLFIVRLDHDELSISADSSGALLHRRGYRLEITRAPLRETLAAAMLLSSGWRPGEPLLDPLCGSGTIPIEAALIAAAIAPGMNRPFAFERWPSFDRDQWSKARETARAGERSSPSSPILGGDRDSGAIQIAGRNAERAGVAERIEFRCQSLSESLGRFSAVAPERGCILSNPPYGIRVAGGVNLRDLYATLATAVREHHWSLGILTPDQKLVRSSGVNAGARFRARNGGIPVTFFVTGDSADSDSRGNVRQKRNDG